MEIKTDQEYITSSRISRHYDLILTFEDGDKEVGVNKWWLDEDGGGTDNDYEIEKEEEIKEMLSGDDWEDLIDYINELK